MKTQEIFNGFDDIIRERFGDECFESGHVDDYWLLDSKVADQLFTEYEADIYSMYGWDYDKRFVTDVMPKVIEKYRNECLACLMEGLRSDAECEHQRTETLRCYRRW